MPLITRTYTIPIVVRIEWQQDFIDAEAKFIATSIQNKIARTLDTTVSIKAWSVDEPDEIQLKGEI